ncbi:MAG: hypothetical protein ACJ78M_04935 [Gemmatimonadaceae bacterium]
MAERERAALPDAKAEARGSVRVDEAPEALASRHVGLAVGNPPRAARPDVSHPRGNRVAAPREAHGADVRAPHASVLALVVRLP